MKIKQRVHVLATMIAVAALFIGFEVYKAYQDEVLLDLSVVFQLERTKPVNISATVNNVVVVAMGTKKSPWGTPIKAPRGSRVILAVFQDASGDNECTILRNGVIMAHEWMIGPGNIACQHVVQ